MAGELESKEIRKGKKVAYTIGAILFVMCITVVCGVNLVVEDRTFSENENRMLAERPEWSLTNVMSGRFMEQYETYVSDQFVGREFWVRFKTFIELLGGKTQSNGVFKGRDNYLLEDIEVPDEAAMRENLKVMKNFAIKHADMPTYMMLVPNAATVLKEKLPPLAETADQNAQIDQIKRELGDSVKWVDVSTALKKNKDKEIYYRSDHHWTSLGAHIAFQEFADVKGMGEGRIAKNEPLAITDQFDGTLSARSGYYSQYNELMYIYVPKDAKTNTVVNYIEEQKKTVSMYDSAKLNGKDKYGVYLGGNNGLVDINTTSNSTERLMVIKDSYANCFIPLLAPYYRQIVVVDPRYYYGDVEELMSANKITEVLFLYNGNTFVTDNQISGVLSSGKSD